MFKLNPLVVITGLTLGLVGTSFVAQAVGEETTQTVSPATTTITVSEPSRDTIPPIAQIVEAAEPSTTAVRVSVPPAPPAPTWDGPIPEYYGAGSGCSSDRASIIAYAMWAEGAFDTDVEWMLNVVSRESTCDSSAYNGNRGTGDDSWGICQLNTLAGFFENGRILDGFDYRAFADDFHLNARACARLWSVCGRGPWTKGDYGCREPDKQVSSKVVGDFNTAQ